MKDNDDEGQASSPDIEMTPLVTEQESNETRNSVHSERQKISEPIFLRARRLLYVSHFFAQFSEIAWQFSVALFLVAFTHYRSLVLVSTYGLTVSAAVCIGGTLVGQYIDRSNRLSVARQLIFAENLAVVLATVCCYLLLSSSPESADAKETTYNDGASRGNVLKLFENVPLDTASTVLLIVIHAMGAWAAIMDRAFLVAIERDWVVVLCQTSTGTVETADAAEQSFAYKLGDTNVTMKQIDLGCKVAAPAIAGFLIPLLSKSGHELNPSGNELKAACAFIGALNGMALLVEYICSGMVYELIPPLASKRLGVVETGSDEEKSDDRSCDRWDDLQGSSNQGSTLLDRGNICRRLLVPTSLKIYFSQSIAMLGLGLAFLYMNPLTFGNGILMAYLLSRGVAMQRVGVLRGIASVIGLLGTHMYRFLTSRQISLESIAMSSIFYQFLCFVVCLISLLVTSQSISLLLLIGGVCLSRIGLWTFDIAVTQIQQERIPENFRGVVGGAQEALNAFFTLASFGLGIICQDPEDFYVFVVAGALSVCIAVVLVFSGSRLVSGNHTRAT